MRRLIPDMHKLSGLLVVSLFVLSTGCAKRVATLYPSSAVAITTSGDGTCAERLLSKSRYTGYIEQTVDKEMGFFRVKPKFATPLEVEGRKVFATEGKGKKAKRKLYAAVPSNYSFAIVEFYNVQCTAPESAVVVPMNSAGALGPEYLMDAAQRSELDRYASQLGSTPVAPAAPFGADE